MDVFTVVKLKGCIKMHSTSFNAMSLLLSKISSSRKEARVLDVGSRIAEEGQASYKSIVQNLGWDYKGLDIEPGINVDIVCESTYKFPLEDNSIDLVISGQVFEHVEFPWEAIKEIHRVLRADGIAVIIAPSSGKEHRYPFDCYRYYPDGMKALGKWAGFSSIVARTNWDETQIFGWGDTIGIFFKNENPQIENSIFANISNRDLYDTWEEYATARCSKSAVFISKKLAEALLKPLHIWNNMFR